MAEEMSIGMVDNVINDTLIITDGLKIYVPNLSLGRYIDENNTPIALGSITFPFTASLVSDERLPEHLGRQSIFVKIHKFYKIVNGRAVELIK